MLDELNPYSAPQAEVLTVPEAAETERREHLGAETRLRALGALLHVWGLLLLLLLLRVWRIFNDMEGIPRTNWLGSPVFSMALGGLLLGFQLYRLRSWAAWVLVLLFALGLLGSLMDFRQPVEAVASTLICAAVLVLLLNRRARRVLASDYRHIIHHTPHIAHRGRTVLWMLAYIGVLILLVALVGPLRQ
jgi:hypothetical protein